MTPLSRTSMTVLAAVAEEKEIEGVFFRQDDHIGLGEAGARPEVGLRHSPRAIALRIS